MKACTCGSTNVTVGKSGEEIESEMIKCNACGHKITGGCMAVIKRYWNSGCKSFK